MMQKIEKITGEYLLTLTERAKKSKIYQSYQLTGLTIAEILNDHRHKALYMKLAKNNNNDELLRLAKKIAENKKIQNKGAYFMSVFYKKDQQPLKS